MVPPLIKRPRHSRPVGTLNESGTHLGGSTSSPSRIRLYQATTGTQHPTPTPTSGGSLRQTPATNLQTVICRRAGSSGAREDVFDSDGNRPSAACTSRAIAAPIAAKQTTPTEAALNRGNPAPEMTATQPEEGDPDRVRDNRQPTVRTRRRRNERVNRTCSSPRGRRTSLLHVRAFNIIAVIVNNVLQNITLEVIHATTNFRDINKSGLAHR